jgi:ornithine carbamoyltransferase
METRVSERVHLLSLSDLDPPTTNRVLQRALSYKKKGSPPVLSGQNIALVFQKPSLRTRVSFTVGIKQLGGDAVYLSEAEVGLGTREPIADIARTLSRYTDAIVARVHFHSDVEALARWSSVPVINGLSDREHPCQVLADLLTVLEQLGGIAGVNLRVATPPAYAPSADVLEEAMRLAAVYETGSKLLWTTDPREAVRGVDFLYTDVWTSMGQEAEAEQRRADFAGYQVTRDLLALAGTGAFVLHDMPVHRGEEIEAEVVDGPMSLIFDQAENRLHAQKALLVELLAREGP